MCAMQVSSDAVEPPLPLPSITFARLLPGSSSSTLNPSPQALLYNPAHPHPLAHPLPSKRLIFSVYLCSREEGQARCEVGDLQHKHALLNVAGRVKELAGTKAFFTDSNLPLSGEASIVGRR